ncbi:outer membrane protein assembly factor BamA [Algiphilus sp.]|uniref:outer membrane protein assembly factor BamA n=1 Tax=Algiphilus sp. TaxID=1872431 RepID=UPI0025C6834A|nr:outer membrane protein assembly factor BamA [Algiphilus sp.]
MIRFATAGWRAAVLLLVLCCATATAAERFIIDDIRVEGLSRLEEGTVLSYLPLVVGDELNEQTAQQSIRSVYDSGLFADVQLLRDGGALVVRVTERPQIASFEIEGNEKIGGDELMESMRSLGLSEGEVFKQSILDQVSLELRRQYFANGFYDVDIESVVDELPNNRVGIRIDVVEGESATIKSINIVGNEVFDDDTLRDELKLQETNWMPFQRSDQYSKQQLGGDLETLTSYYQDRGYLRFTIEDVQVQLSPDKRDIYVTITVDEGEVYSVAGTRFTGETVLNEQFLNAMVTTEAGDTFSRRLATESSDRIEAALANVGFAFAEVQPVPEPVEGEDRKITINYVVDPKKRTYVRQIRFRGNTGTNDETLRRELRQLEAAPFSQSAVERSRVRIDRLSFIESTEVDTQPVPGTDDLVDVVFTVKERPPGSVQVGVGFSGADGFLVSGSVTHANFLGTGNRVSVNLENNTFSQQVSLSWSDPYFTEDGISQTISGYFRKSDRIIRFSSGFSSNVLGGDLTYGIPISEYSTLRAGVGVSETSIETFAGQTSDEVIDFVSENGKRFTAWQLRTGIARDTRNRTIFVTRGNLIRLNADIVLPGSDLRYFSTSLTTQHHLPLLFGFIAQINTSVGYVDTYGNEDTVPPYENYFAGGTRTVRGYRDGTLGPRDTPFDNPFGGKLRTTSQTELIVPLPFEADGQSTRFSLFFDIGNVFEEPGDFEANELRQSAGVAFRWFTPFLGILNLSYGFPLNDEPGDETDRFQINFGTGF